MVYCTDPSAKQRQKTRLSLDGQAFRQYLGVSALADRMLVDAAALIALPETVGFTAGALLGCRLTTGIATIFNTAGTQPGQSVLVIGCGGVGLGAVQAARIVGAAPIIAVDPQFHRRKTALDLGATDIIDPVGIDLAEAVASVTGRRGIDVAVEAVGELALAEAAFAALAPGGRAVVGMMPPSSRITLPASLLRHGRSLTGSVMGEVRPRHDIPAYLQMAASGNLITGDLATSTWPLDQVNDAFEHAISKRGIRTMIEF
jgi:S-(hydroxymethyl)glutathione dehydrogenase/alcohol dehydrogenase